MTQLTLGFLLAFLIQNAPPPAVPAARATVSGIVTRAGSEEPIGRAQITLTRVAAPATLGVPGAAPPTAPAPATPQGARGAAAPAIPAPPVVLTDKDGKFVVNDVPAGSYRIAAVRNGFSRQEFGQRSTRTPGAVITLAAGQSLKDVSFHLTPAGTVTGRLTSEVGEPLAGVTIQLLRSTYNGTGKRTFTPSVTTKTNDLGEYRLYWVTPGTYYLNATTSGNYIESLLQGALNSAASSPAAQDSNGSNGAANINALLGKNANEAVEPGYAVTYFPGTADPTRAIAVMVQPGVESSAMDFTLARQQTFKVQGRVFDTRAGGPPETAIIQMAPRDTTMAAAPMTGSYNASSGTFVFPQTPPGQYVVIALVVGANGPTAGIGVGQQNVDVNGDIDDVSLSVKPGVTVPGRISMEGPAAAAPGFERMRVRLVPATELALNASQPPPTMPDGAFTMENVAPGDYHVAIIGLPANYYVKAARFGRNDVLVDNMNVSGDGPGPLEILISPNAGQITGLVQDRDSKPVGATQVVMVPDRQRDRRDLYRTAQSDQSGRYTLQGVPPGDYRLFVWEDIEPNSYNDPEVLRQYETQGAAVRVAESGRITQDLKIIPATN